VAMSAETLTKLDQFSLSKTGQYLSEIENLLI
jgi:hypothetical protein